MGRLEKPALYGGQPIRDELLPYGSQWIDEEDIEAVVKVLKSPFLTQGPQIAMFEESVAKASGAQYAVAFANGTAALHGACFAAGIGPGDEVITTPLTFAASANCVLYQGGTPVFADVDGLTYLLDLEKVKEKITSRTKVIIPVDYTGQPIDMDAYMSFARDHNLIVIQDGAHSLGASFSGKQVGSMADMTMFSFHPAKPVTSGEGGVIVTNSREYYEKLLLFRTHGITKDQDQLENPNEGPWHYEMHELGYNYRITDIQGALGISQLKKLEPFIHKRRDIAAYYNQQFGDLEKLGLIKRPYQHPLAESGWHLYILQLELSSLTAGRREVFEAFRAENIGVHVHYPLVYHHPYYRRLGYATNLCPVAEEIYKQIITLPLYPKMTGEDMDDVVNAVKKVIFYYAKRS